MRKDSQGADTGRNGGEDRKSAGKTNCVFVCFSHRPKGFHKKLQKYLEAANIGFTCNFCKESPITYAAVCQVP